MAQMSDITFLSWLSITSSKKMPLTVQYKYLMPVWLQIQLQILHWVITMLVKQTATKISRTVHRHYWFNLGKQHRQVKSSLHDFALMSTISSRTLLNHFWGPTVENANFKQQRIHNFFYNNMNKWNFKLRGRRGALWPPWGRGGPGGAMRIVRTRGANITGNLL
jgi:hypothetical protein